MKSFRLPLILVASVIVIVCGVAYAAVPIPPNVPVSGPQPGLQNEEQVWVCPKDTQIVVTNHRDFRLGYRQIGIGRSPDGGASWIDSLIHPDYQIFTHQSDPVMTVNAAGDIIICHLDYRRDVYPRDSSCLAFLVSSDCGATWNGPYTVEDSIGPYFEDKQFISCDRTGGPYDGNIYISWTRFDPPTRIMFARSTNNAVDWDDTLIVGAPPYVSCLNSLYSAGQFSQPLVGKDGAVYVFWAGVGVDSLDGNCDVWTSLVMNKSIDGGVTWQGERRLFSISGWGEVDGGVNIHGQPVTDADLTDGPHAGNLYLQYRDTVSSPTWESDIFFRRSLDTGHTWSQPIRVNDDPIGPDIDQFHNWMICNNEGILVSIWYDQRTDPAHYMFDVFAAYSFDGGVTWTSNHRVSSVSISPDYLASTASKPAYDDVMSPQAPLEVQSPQAGLIAEYIGVSCIDDKVVAVWTDTRDATGPGDQDVYAAHWYLPLTVPRLLLPEQDTWVDSQANPGFDWSTCWKEEADAYRVQIDDDPGFTLPIIDVIVDSSGYNESIEHFADGEYFWRVKAYKKAGELLADSTEYSETWNFIVPIIECFCDYQCDFDEDFFLTALDLSALIDVLFVGQPDIQDPGCWTTRGDFDADGFATALDLAGLIDHLFAGQAGPCDPCEPSGVSCAK